MGGAAAAKFPVNAAIREIAAAHQLSAHDLAQMLYVSEETVSYWMRSRPTRAPKMALALLCLALDLPAHSALQ